MSDGVPQQEQSPRIQLVDLSFKKHEERTGFLSEQYMPPRPFFSADIGKPEGKHYYFPPEMMLVRVIKEASEKVGTFVPDAKSGYMYPIGGTFFLLNNGILITQAHCLIASNIGPVKDREIIFQGKKISLADAEILFVPSADEVTRADKAVLRVPQLAQEKGLVLSTEEIQKGSNVFSSGYPDTYNGQEKVIVYGEVLDVNNADGTFVHDCQVRQGQSGSPILNAKGEVVGMVYQQPEGLEEFTTRAVALNASKIRELLK